MARHERVAEELAEMALGMHHEPTVEQTLDRVLEFALKAVDSAYAGVLFVTRDGQVETAAATNQLIAEVDQLQVACGEGPDIEILQDRYSLIIPDTRVETRWPAWAERVSSIGIRSLLNVRLYTDTKRVGTLNFYDPEPDHFDIGDQQVAHIFARHAAIALSSALNLENVWLAADSRNLIGQAQGILMERYGLTTDQAFSVLSRYSQEKNLKLRVLAEQLIEGRTLPD